MRMLSILAGLAMLAGEAAAQKPEDLNFVSGLSEYRDFQKMLPAYLHRAALELLEQRKHAVTSAAERKTLLRRRLTEAVGGFPERTPLNARVTGVLERDGYRIEKVV